MNHVRFEAEFKCGEERDNEPKKIIRNIPIKSKKGTTRRKKKVKTCKERQWFWNIVSNAVGKSRINNCVSFKRNCVPITNYLLIQIQ